MRSLLHHAGYFIEDHGLSSCTSVIVVIVAYELHWSVACGILVAWPGIEPVSPELQGGFLTTGLPEKSHGRNFLETREYGTKGTADSLGIV